MLVLDALQIFLKVFVFLGSTNGLNGFGNNLSQAPFVGNGPGAIALILILYLAHSAANDLVKAKTPPFAAADGATYPEPVQA